jgi:hypothetical protein
MGVHIVHDEERGLAALFCSTSDFAFGPVFSAKDGRSAEERAENFQRWLLHRSTWPCRVAGIFGRFDARTLDDQQLMHAYSEWLAQEDEQVEAELREAKEALAAEEARDIADEERAARRFEETMRLHPEYFR